MHSGLCRITMPDTKNPAECALYRREGLPTIPSAAISAAAATATVTATATTAAATGTRFVLRFVDFKSAAIEFLAVKSGNGFVGAFHFNKSKPA